MIEIFYRNYIDFRSKKQISPFFSYLGERKVRIKSMGDVPSSKGWSFSFTIETPDPLSPEDLEFLEKCEGFIPCSQINRKEDWSSDPWKNGHRLQEEIDNPPRSRHFMEDAVEDYEGHSLKAYERNKWDRRS